MKALRIKNWDDHFENSESRKIKRAAYVCVPNKHDGKGYARIAMHKQSCRVFTGWMLILQVASKMPKRGLLVDEDGALDVDDLAAMTRFDAATFETAIEALTDPKIGWLEWVEMDGPQASHPDTSGRHPDTSGDHPETSRRVGPEQNRTEQNGTEQDRTERVAKNAGQQEETGERESGDSQHTPKTPPKDGVDFYGTAKGHKLTGQQWIRFEEFWKAWIRDWHVRRDSGKRAAADSWRMIEGYTDELAETIVRAAKIEAANRPDLIARGDTPKWAQGWIRERRWESCEPDTTPLDEIVDAFNSIVATDKIAKLQTPTGARKEMLAILHHALGGIDGITRYFQRVARSNALMGNYGARPAKADWLIDYENAARVLDGQFDSKR